MSLSLGTAAVGFLLGNPTLYEVMRLGDRFERWCTCAWSSRSLMLTTGNHHPRYRVVRIRFECRVRTAKSPARGPEWTDPHQKASPAIANARPCVMIFSRRYETEDTGANSRSPDRPLNEATDGREEDTIAASTCLCTESCTVLLPVLTVALGTGRCAEGGGRSRGHRGRGIDSTKTQGERLRLQ